MNLIDNNLSQLLKWRSHWLTANTQVITENIVRADMPHANRHELKPFQQLISEQQDALNKNLFSSTSFKIQDKDISSTQTEISKEDEMLCLSQNAAEHDTIISIMKRFMRMMQIVGNKST